MTSKKSETGHVVNIGNFKGLLNYCNLLGAKYNPSNAAIGIANMQAVYTASSTAQSALNAAKTPLVLAVNDRAVAFDPLNKLMTRVVNEVGASDVPAQFVKDIRSLTKKISGVRIVPKIKQDPNTPPEALINYISASQTGVDHKLDNLDQLISLLSAEPHYAPSETDLTTASLTTYYNSLVVKNDVVSVQHSAMVIARNTRDVALYKTSGGAVEIGGRTKKYIKSVFGGDSMEYHEVAKFKLRKVRK